MRFLGVDPGAKGAICLLDASTQEASFSPTPVRDGKPRAASVFSNLMAVTYIDSTPCAVEDVHSLYGMSAKSNFAMGYNLGAIHAILQACGIDYDLVKPKEWQKVCGVTRQGEEDMKQATARRALELYPDAKIYGPRGGLLDGRADALMIAHYRFIKYMEFRNEQKVPKP